MHRPRTYHTQMSMLDLFLLIVLGFVGLFFIAFVMMNPKEKAKKQTESKAEFMLTFSWPKDVNDDVDAYLQDPLGNLVCFKRREDGLMHLDRDDRGSLHDTIQTAFGVIKSEENQEIITIRGIVPGEYTCNVHMYGKNNKEPTEVTVKCEKINPSVTLVALKKVTLENNGDEKTLFRMTLDKEGKVIDVNELEKSIAAPTVNQNNHYGDPGEEPYGSGSNPEGEDYDG